MHKLILMIILIFFAWNINAQKSISLEEALGLVKQNHPTVLQQDLYVEQQRILKNASSDLPGIQQNMLSTGYAFDELGVLGTGLHSLYVTHSFNLPRVAKNKALYQEELAKSGIYQKEATQKELERYIAGLYQQILYSKSQQKLNLKLLAYYNNLEQLAQKKVDLGENNLAAVLALQTVQNELVLKGMQYEQSFLIQVEMMKEYLLDSSIVDIQDSTLSMPQQSIANYDTKQHPLVREIEQNIVANDKRKQLIEDQLLPQISWGFQTQMVDLNFPNFGGQIGVNIPLLNRNVKAEIKANNLNKRILEQSRNWQIQQLNSRQKIAMKNISGLEAQVNHLRDVVLPSLQKQQDFIEKAFRLGELDYLSVLQNTRQIILIENQYLQLLFQLNLAWIEYRATVSK